MHWFAAVISAVALAGAASIALAQQTRPAQPDGAAHTVTPGTSPASVPATLPAEAPGSSSTQSAFPDPDVLLKQLSSPDWQERRAAKETLVRLGEEAKPYIQELIRRAGDEEAKHQAQAALTQIDENRVLGPSYVTLHVKNAGPAEVFAALARQCYAPLPAMPENLWTQGNFPRLTMDVDRRPFWEVLPTVCRQFGVDLRPFQTNLRLMRTGGNQLQGLGRVEGAFLVLADRIVYTRTRLLGAGRRETSNFGMSIMIYPEPKLTLLRGTTTLRLLEAVDDRGNSLAPPNAAKGISNGSFGGSAAVQLYAPLEYPKRNAGTKIVKFRANASFNVQTKVQQIQVSDVLKVDNHVVNVHGMTITFRSLRQKGDGYELRMNIVQPIPAPDFRDIYDQAQTRLMLLDSRGAELPHRGMTTHANGNGIDITLEFAGSPPALVPDKLLWEIPTEFKEVTVPINFTDVPLFDGN